MTNKQWFGDIYTSSTARGPAVVEHSSPADLKARQICSIAVPPVIHRWGWEAEADPQLLQGPGIGFSEHSDTATSPPYLCLQVLFNNH